MHHMSDAIQFRRIMPGIRKKIPAQDLHVPGEIGRSESAYRPAHAFVGGFFIVGPHQADDLAVERGLEDLRKERASQKTGYTGKEDHRGAPRALSRKTVCQAGTPCAYILALPGLNRSVYSS